MQPFFICADHYFTVLYTLSMKPVFFMPILLRTGRSNGFEPGDAQAVAFLIAEQIALGMQLVPHVAFGKEIRAQRIDVHQAELAGPQRSGGRSLHFDGNWFFLPGPLRSGNVFQLPLVVALVLALNQAANNCDQREFGYWSRAVLSNDLNAAERIGAQFLRTGRKHVCREDVRQDIKIGFVAETPASAVRRHSRLDESEQTFQTVLPPVLHELLTLERRPSLTLKIV